jgi:DNA-binding response OmpR family regulator
VRVLLIEDEESIGRAVQQGLQKERYVVEPWTRRATDITAAARAQPARRRLVTPQTPDQSNVEEKITLAWASSPGTRCFPL